ncbi:M48 family metalloprotease [Pseudomonas sp. 2822-15]
MGDFFYITEGIFEKFSPEEITSIICHEIGHLKLYK